MVSYFFASPKLTNNAWYATLKHTEGKVSIVPIANNLRDILLYRKQDIGYVFPSYHKDPRNASKVFRKYADRVKLTAKFHDLRHTSATFMIMKSVNTRIIQQSLGHSDIKTTEIYTKLGTEFLKVGKERVG